MGVHLVCSLLSTLLVAAGCPSFADTPQPTPIKLGMSTALSGESAHLGLNVRAGIEAAIAKTNSAGGIQGRTLQLICLDDGYEPARAGPNMRQLVGDPAILAIVGNLGTPTAVVALPIAREGNIAFFGAITGAGVLRKIPPDPNVINYRAGYSEETAAMVAALVRHAHVRPEEVSFFTQRDAYGDAGFEGGLSALHAHGLPDKLVPLQARYERNTVEVEGAVADMLAAATPPKAIIMVGTATPTAKFVRLLHEHGLSPILLSVSFVGSHELATQLEKDGDGIIITQVVPHPSADLPITREFRCAIDPSHRDSFSALEGYLSGCILCRALQSMSTPPTRTSVISALESLGKFDLGMGVELELSSTRHQASNHIWPTRLRAGQVLPMDWAELETDKHVLTPTEDPSK